MRVIFNMAEQLTSTKNKDIHIEALKRFNTAVSCDEDQRAKATDDTYFSEVEDRQWDEHAKKIRLNRPRYTINKVAAAVREVIADYKQNRVELKLRPKNDESKELLDTYTGLVKSIMSEQSAKLAKDNAFKGIATGGISAWRVLPRFNEDSVFDQDITVEPIWQPLTSVWFDPMAKHPAGRDQRYCFVVEDMAKEVFQAKWPKASTEDFQDTGLISLQKAWYNKEKETVRVAEYFRRTEVREEVVQLSDGRVISVKDFDAGTEQFALEQITEVRRKSRKTFEVKRYMMNGSQILQAPDVIPSQFITIIRVLGFYVWLDGKLHYMGMVRNAKDPAMIYNYSTTANIEATALAPKNKLLYTKKMTAGYEREWKNMNVSNAPGLPFNPDESFPGLTPTPLSFAQQPNMALLQQSQQAELDIQGTMGRRAPAQGEAPSDRSGRAILALQRQSDQSTFDLNDSITISEEFTGEVIIDMMPRVYDGERQVRIIGTDEKEEIVLINQTVKDDLGNDVLINDVSQGKFSVKAAVGPAFETQRVEELNILNSLSENPEFAPFVPDLIAKSLDSPVADELQKRIRKVMIQQGRVEPNEDEQAELAEAANSPQAQQQAQIEEMTFKIQLATMEASLKQIELQNVNLAVNADKVIADTAEKNQAAKENNADTEKARTDNFKTLVDAVIAQREAGIPILPQQLLVMEQTLALLSANLTEDETRMIETQLQTLQQPQ